MNAALSSKLQKLRLVITENLRVQLSSSELAEYVDASSVIGDVCAKQNHAIFARRGCGKTLLLHSSARKLDNAIKVVYINCEDYKRHSFPDVLIEILDAVFGELESTLHALFGKKRKAKKSIKKIRKTLKRLQTHPDQRAEKVRKKHVSESSDSADAGAGLKIPLVDVFAKLATEQRTREEVERTFTVQTSKLSELDTLLPELKRKVREFFDASTTISAAFLQVDDLYLLRPADQPFVVDYIHRLCKDVPLYFKIATLRHASNMYVDRSGQPIGAQERHDYQPINIDYTFSDFKRTRDQNHRILYKFGTLAGMRRDEIDSLFKGQGFDRLIMAGGGVPRDVLSIFLEALRVAQNSGGDGRIGKDDIRTLSGTIFERRIQELKQDSEGDIQDALLRGIYVLREFCLHRAQNIFVVSEQEIQQDDHFRSLLYRLLDYRIIHSVATALTHKSQEGTYRAFAIDIGCYAHLRKLYGRFVEIDVSDPSLKEKSRSAPRFRSEDLSAALLKTPTGIEVALKAEPN